MDSREKFSEDFLVWIGQQCLLMFNASEKVNSIKDNLRWRHVHILIFISWKNKLFHNIIKHMPERAFGSGLQETAIFARPIFLPKFQRPHVLLRLSHGPRPHFSNIFLVLVPSELEKNPHPSQKRIWIVLGRPVPSLVPLIWMIEHFNLIPVYFRAFFALWVSLRKSRFFHFPRGPRGHITSKRVKLGQAWKSRIKLK